MGKWTWDEESEEWIYDEYPPLGDLPQTGVAGNLPALLAMGAGLSILTLGLRGRKQ